MIHTEWRKQSPRPVAIIRLDRPGKKNALTPAMLDDLCAALSQAASGVGGVEGVGGNHGGAAEPGAAAAIVLAGSGAAFCAGFDLTLCKDDSGVLGALLRGLSRTIRLMRELPVPIIAAAHGAAIAGGCAMLAGADIVVTHAGCRLGYPVVRLGISPAINAPFLLDAIGPGPSREWLLGGQVVSGDDAYRCGLAHELAATPEQVIDVARTIADHLAAKPSVGLDATKRWMNELSSAEASAAGALAASLDLVGSAEERSRLAALWG